METIKVAAIIFSAGWATAALWAASKGAYARASYCIGMAIFIAPK